MLLCHAIQNARVKYTFERYALMLQINAPCPMRVTRAVSGAPFRVTLGNPAFASVRVNCLGGFLDLQWREVQAPMLWPWPKYAADAWLRERFLTELPSTLYAQALLFK